MYKFLLLLSIVAITCYSCKGKIKSSKNIPTGIIDKATMANILADIHIAENISGKDRKVDSINKKINTYYFAIFKKYNISSDKFTRSMDYYLSNPDILQEVYESTTEILNTRKIE